LTKKSTQTESICLSDLSDVVSSTQCNNIHEEYRNTTKHEYYYTTPIENIVVNDLSPTRTWQSDESISHLMYTWLTQTDPAMPINIKLLKYFYIDIGLQSTLLYDWSSFSRKFFYQISNTSIVFEPISKVHLISGPIFIIQVHIYRFRHHMLSRTTQINKQIIFAVLFDPSVDHRVTAAITCILRRC